jgi:(p)ppGpp synthase/HD superfamily hydrolase
VTPRYTQALNLAARAHQGQTRKGTPIPYIVHPVAVAGLVARYGGDEDQQIAALLHDVLEDGGLGYQREIAGFGPRVLDIVWGCTDGTPDERGQKQEWRARKAAFLDGLRTAPEETLLVSGCDKLSNAHSILEDLIEIGSSVFDRFRGSREGTLWYYEELIRLFSARQAPMSEALGRVMSEIRRRDGARRTDDV